MELLGCRQLAQGRVKYIRWRSACGVAGPWMWDRSAGRRTLAHQLDRWWVSFFFIYNRSANFFRNRAYIWWGHQHQWYIHTTTNTSSCDIPTTWSYYSRSCPSTQSSSSLLTSCPLYLDNGNARTLVLLRNDGEDKKGSSFAWTGFG